MNNSCDEMRLVVEASLGGPLEPDEEENLKRHLAGCPSCRAYREALLADDSLLDELASSHADSFRRVEERAVFARSVGTGTAPHPTLARRLSRVPRAARISAAAAAAIAVIVVAGFIRGTYFGPIPAFAAVLENAMKAENVTFRVHHWIDGAWRAEERFYDRSGTSRIDYGDSILVDRRSGPWSLALYPAKKLAVVRQSTFHAWINSGRDKDGAIEQIATLHKKHSFTFVRRERHEGKNIAVFECTFDSEFEKSEAAISPQMRTLRRELGLKFVTWVDLDTSLPVRIEFINSSPRCTAESGPYGLRLRDFMPPDVQQEKAAGWIELPYGEPHTIMNEFRWNAPVDWDDITWNATVDTSLFGMNPPADYTIQRIQDSTVTDKKTFETAIRRFPPETVLDIQKGLAEWISLFDITFPDSLRDMADVSRIRPRLIAKYNGDGVPGDEYRSAIHAAKRLEYAAKPRFNVTRPPEARKDATYVTYAGKGCAFGDSTKAICWVGWGEQDNPRWIIYADLHAMRSNTPPKR
jgi:hypothetical protein